MDRFSRKSVVGTLRYPRDRVGCENRGEIDAKLDRSVNDAIEIVAQGDEERLVHLRSGVAGAYGLAEFALHR